MKHKIVMVAACPFPANHGSPASIREMSESLVDLGHDVHIVTYPIKEDIPVNGPIIHRVYFPLLNKERIKVGPSSEKFIYDPLMIIKLISVIWREKIDIIHAHNYEGALIGWVAKIITRRPMLYNAVNNMTDELVSYDFFKSKKFAIILAKILDNIVPRTGNFTTVVSDTLKLFLIKKGVPGDKIQVLPAGVNARMFPKLDKASLRKKYNYELNAKIIIYTGSLDVFQRIDYLLEATALLQGHFNQLKLVLAANVINTSDIERIKEQITRLKLGEVVDLLEDFSLEELPEYLALSDIATLPRTDCPGHPVKLLNYMSSGIPIVGFVGAAKGLHHMKNAYLADDHDIAQFAHGIRLLFENPDIASVLSYNAKETQVNLYEWKLLAKGIAVIYEMLRLNDFDSKRLELKRYIRDSYQPRFLERRSFQENSSILNFPCRRKVTRRKNEIRIEFIERRRIIDAE